MKILSVLTLLVFIVSCFFLIREPVSLLWVIPLSLISYAYGGKLDKLIQPILTITICIISLLWVNSKLPIWGELYENKVSVEEYERNNQRKSVDLIVAGQNAVKAKLKDPSSAKFINDFTNKYSNIEYYCGLIQSKNSFGAYTGAQKFVSNGVPSGTFLQEEVSDFNTVWDKFCQ